GNWYLMVVTYDGTTAKLYVNGNLENSGTGTVIAPTSGFQWGMIGGQENYSGSMDDIRIYSRTLSATEVQALYNLPN
ncbi:MAG TPA: LamG domain-containing protein, partial [Candidatus Saccharimonadales bacterium]|nr:LamG domain-containing protein [Candidatus Saccharimonadales bacterium]